MELSQLQIYDVRNLQCVKLPNLHKINLFFGPNGAGKTSILEAVHLLGMGRSFRGKSIKPLISHEKQNCTVFGGLFSQGVQATLGVKRSVSGDVQIKVGGKAVRSAAQLIEYLPLQVINADSFDLLVGSPKVRRQYLDWGVFHVEHRFFNQWQQFQRCIKQRNNLLRRGKISAEELAVWTKKLAISGRAINAFRRDYFDQLVPVFHETMRVLAPEISGLELHFRQGWDKSLEYEQALKAHIETDISRGFTHVGPQRADIRVTIEGHSAADTLSRGQQKLVVCALKLAQGQLMTKAGKGVCTYLVDDLAAELDKQHCQLVCELLSSMNVQVFLTSIEQEDIVGLWPEGDDFNMFHVEHGAVSSIF